MLVGISQLHNSSWKTVKGDVTIMYNAGSRILKLELHVTQKYNLRDIVFIVVKLYTRTYWQDCSLKIQFRNNIKYIVVVKLTKPHKNVFRSTHAYC